MTRHAYLEALLQSGRMTRRSLLALGTAAGIAALSTVQVAQAQSASKPPASPTGQVVVGISQEPTVFNPLLSSIEVDHGVWWNIYDPLWGVNEKGDFIPKLAKEIPTVENGGISADGLNWKIKLREDAKWHDGTPFTAEDVKFTLELINRPGFNARTRQGHDLVRDIKVVNDHEVTWRMERLSAPYMSQLASTFIVPAHILSKAEDPNKSTFNQQPVGTGPFKLESRVSGDRVVLQANPDYFGDGPYLERVIFKYIPDSNGLYTQFRTGQVDVAGIHGIPANFYEEASKLPNLVVMPNPSSIESITPNHDHPALKELAVRQALYGAINKQAIIDLIYYGLPKPTESFYPQQSWAYDSSLPKQVFDIEASKKILEDAGWKVGKNGIREKNGVPLSFDISTTSGNELRAQTQQLLQQDWKKIGADVKINNMPAAVMWGEYWFKSKFDTTLVSVNFMTGNDPDVSYRFNSKASPARGGSGSNVSLYNNPEADKLMEAGQRTMDRAERTKIYADLQKMLRDDLIILPLYQSARVEGYKKGLVGYQDNINVQSNAWNAGTWYWTK